MFCNSKPYKEILHQQFFVISYTVFTITSTFCIKFPS